MPVADFDSRHITGDQRTGNTDILFATQKPFGIEKPEGEADDGGHRGERDIALVPIEADAENLLALIGAAADDAGAAGRGRVAAGVGLGQGEAGNLFAPR